MTVHPLHPSMKRSSAWAQKRIVYQKKLNEIESNDYKGEVSEEIEDFIKKGEIKLIIT